jgi:hypothetical protein
MAGLLDDYGIDADEIPDISYEVPDGVYRYELGGVIHWQDEEGSRKAIRFDFLLDDEDGTTGQKSEWFNMPEDPENPTDYEMQTLARMKRRIVELGIPKEEAGNAGEEELVGLTGTLQIVSVPGKGKNKGKTYQNIRNVRPDEVDEAPAAPAAKAKAPVGKAAGVKKNPFGSK